MSGRSPARPRLSDRAALTGQRRRAERAGLADWLHRIARDEIEDRLALVNRTFTRAAIVTGLAGPWRDLLPGAVLVEDSETLDLPAELDLVVHAMALHWADDPVGQIIQCARALRPDGLFLAVAPGGETLHELRDALGRAEAEVTGGMSPRVLPMGDLRDLGALPGRAGLALPVADHIAQQASYRDLAHLARDLRAMGETNAMEARLRRPTRRAVMDRAAELMARHHPDPLRPGRVLATFDLIFLSGWAPAPGQSQPLRPGSARLPLSMALNARSDDDP